MKKIRGALRGFTLTEMLVALMVVGLLTAVTATITPMAMRAYRQSSTTSAASTLCSTLSTSIASELRYATDVRQESGKVTFTSPTRGTGVSLESDSSTGMVNVLIPYAGSSDVVVPLLGEKSYADGLRAQLVMDYDDDGGAVNVQLTILGQWGDEEDYVWASSTFSVCPLNL